jgi:hypothetical protein
MPVNPSPLEETPAMREPLDSVPPAPVIHPRQVFSLEQARRALGLPPSTLPRECRLGRLRYSLRGGQRWILGAWLLAWLRAGEVQRGKRRRRPTTATVNGTE